MLGTGCWLSRQIAWRSWTWQHNRYENYHTPRSCFLEKTWNVTKFTMPLSAWQRNAEEHSDTEFGKILAKNNHLHPSRRGIIWLEGVGKDEQLHLHTWVLLKMKDHPICRAFSLLPFQVWCPSWSSISPPHPMPIPGMGDTFGWGCKDLLCQILPSLLLLGEAGSSTAAPWIIPRIDNRDRWISGARL